jgi:hypothetical protein
MMRAEGRTEANVSVGARDSDVDSARNPARPGLEKQFQDATLTAHSHYLSLL